MDIDSVARKVLRHHFRRPESFFPNIGKVSAEIGVSSVGREWKWETPPVGGDIHS
ncbi:hypothetical protein OIE13_15420 [Streptosporangium sp. NBC_01810]|uniref:hypothetical protein n=1 Tax=Streptosporangium sp. NBC_01810 TaxID=2975951 RepID=UPI002DD8D813|nr:hypothetical protein [Streptosporangium sp. NBC_01810]WSA29140.1 hypothetical protein OIE13_15420 [Streptosporangium sp. NBC_01810]